MSIISLIAASNRWLQTNKAKYKEKNGDIIKNCRVRMEISFIPVFGLRLKGFKRAPKKSTN